MEIQFLRVCSREVVNSYPDIHEVFCNGECGRPQREDYKSGYEFCRAMAAHMKAKTRNPKKNGTIRQYTTTGSGTQAKII